MRCDAAGNGHARHASAHGGPRAAAPVQHAATAHITQQQAAASSASGGMGLQQQTAAGRIRQQQAAVARGCSAQQAARGQREPRAHGEGGHTGDAAWREKLEERFRAEVHYLFA